MTAEEAKEVVPESSGSSSAQPSAAEEEQVKKLMDSDKEETLKTALNSLVQGKRHLLVKDFLHAGSALGDACKLLVEVYGPISSEHADAHMYYGKALLEQARQELSVFQATDAKDGEKESDEDEDEDDEEDDGEGEEGDEDEAAETAEESPEEAEAGPSGSSTTVAAEATAGSSTETTEEDLSASSPKPGPSSAVDDEQPSTSKGVTASADETMGEDEPSTVELAFEVFEIAKLGFHKQMEMVDQKLAEAAEDKKADVELQRQALQKKIADTHAYLGEVSIEIENYERAVEDLMTAIKEYEEIGNMPREIAQCYFHIGLAHGFDKKYSNSIESFEQAVKLIQTRIDDLKSEVEKGAKAEPVDKDTQEKLQNEIKELEELIPELKGRINDTLEQEQEAKKAEAEEKMEEEVIERNSPVKNPNPPAANDISHLVKKKRKLEPEAVSTNGNGVTHADEVTEPPGKKACTSEENGATNGHATATTTNGNSATIE